MITPSKTIEKANINQDFPIGKKECLNGAPVARGGSRWLKSLLWSLETSLKMKSKSVTDERPQNRLIEEVVDPESKIVYIMLNQLITSLIKGSDWVDKKVIIHTETIPKRLLRDHNNLKRILINQDKLCLLIYHVKIAKLARQLKHNTYLING